MPIAFLNVNPAKINQKVPIRSGGAFSLFSFAPRKAKSAPPSLLADVARSSGRGFFWYPLPPTTAHPPAFSHCLAQAGGCSVSTDIVT